MPRKSFSFQKRLRIYWRDQFTCRYCGRAIHPLSEDLTLDHIDPAGGDDDDNLATACRSCNSAKGARVIFQPLNIAEISKAIEGPTGETPSAIILRICKDRRLTTEQLRSPKRDMPLVAARTEVARALRGAGLTYSQIATLLGKKDHSTIVHMLRDVDKPSQARKRAV